MKYWHQEPYSSRRPVPTVTLGLSLGETRDLTFHHIESEREFRMPLKNGDVFAFDDEFNYNFMHAIRPVPNSSAAEGISIIIWAAEKPITQPVLRVGPDHNDMPDSLPRIVSWSGLHMTNPSSPNQKSPQHILVGRTLPNSNSPAAVLSLQALRKQGARKRRPIKRHCSAAARFQFERSLITRCVTMLGFLHGCHEFRVNSATRETPVKAVPNHRCGVAAGCTHHLCGLHMPLVHMIISCAQ